MEGEKQNLNERTLIILKLDALQRGLLGEILKRFELKGLKILGIKMIRLRDVMLDVHYAHHRDKSFFSSLKKFMKSSPVMVAVLEGLEAVKVVRAMVGPTLGRDALSGTIRGDFSMSGSANIIHASDSPAIAEKEIKRFFKSQELFNYQKATMGFLYNQEELGK